MQKETISLIDDATTTVDGAFETETPSDYIDLCSIYDSHDDPPPGLFDPFMDDLPDPGNPFCAAVVRQIGNTWYSIRTECGGTELLTHKLRRLIFTDSSDCDVRCGNALGYSHENPDHISDPFSESEVFSDDKST